MSTLIRPATESDGAAVAEFAAELASSFAFSRSRFAAHFATLLHAPGACLLVATSEDGVPERRLGYLLGFAHLSFYANGPVGWVEEVLVRTEHRGLGVGRELMTAFERWATQQDCALVALATRRATAFYAAIGYEESASYLRKVLPGAESAGTRHHSGQSS